MPAAPTVCDTHADLFNFRHPLRKLTESLTKPGKTKLVAIGSSSTAGEGDVVPYPARLEILLREHFHDRMIEVLNRGVGGQEATSELLRFSPTCWRRRPRW